MFFSLHLPTLSLVLFLAYLSNWIFSLLLFLGKQTFRGSLLWVSGQGIFCLALLGLGLRELLPPFYNVVVNNSLYMVSLLVIIQSIWIFRFTRPFPRSVYFAVPLIFFSFWIIQQQSMAFRSAVFSLEMFLFTGAIAMILLWRLRTPFIFSNILIAVPFFLTGIFSLVRFFLNIFTLTPDDATVFTEMNLVFVLLGVIAAPLMLFGYLMMHHQRTARDLKKKDEQIEARNQELLAVNHSKDLFFSIIAHDLRGPIGGAARYVRKNLLDKRDIIPEKRSEIEILAGTLDRTHEFLEKLLWWARSYQEAWKPNKVELNLGEVVLEALKMVEPEVEAKDLKIILDSQLPVSLIWFDRECLRMILQNLLSNAIKFSDLGAEILIDWKIDGNEMIIRITDFGVGLSREQINRLFRMEDKITSRGTRGESGSGMGLILSQNLTSRNGGKLILESPGPGEGTTAILSLPMHGSRLD
ncbi:MAG: hypothetical protein A2Z96_02160 [Spirochaetes bacterium GWB1_48_6]|nr:MAG: hypothetical protein A2Z96_02160 [Spirochaetes bacterium GWB1_48_6]